jgi:hypothetical protein
MLNNIVGLLGVGTPVSTNSYESIASTTAGAGGIVTVSFTSIPSTYKHLQIRAISRTSNATALDDTNIRFNSDSGTNYRAHQLRGNGASATAADLGAFTSATVFAVPGTSALSGVFAGGIIDILDYTNTNKYTTVRAISGYDENGAGNVFLRSALWLNTAAITQIDIQFQSGAYNAPQYSSFALYGIKG